jgi:hypothetical protein
MRGDFQKTCPQSSKMISPPIDAPADSDIIPALRRKTPARKRTMTRGTRVVVNGDVGTFIEFDSKNGDRVAIVILDEMPGREQVFEVRKVKVIK